VRALASSGSAQIIHRPLAAAFSRQVTSACWALRLEFSDGNDDLLWDTLVGAVHGLVGTMRTPREIRAGLAGVPEAIARAVLASCDAQVNRLVSVIQRPTALLAARERAIAAEIRARHARLAATLLQPGLFDRRQDRQAAAQHAALLDLLRQTAARLARLEQRSSVTGAVTPAFVALRR
jgi:hypothetical protein